MTVLGPTDVSTEKEIDNEIKYYERRKWLRPGKDKSTRQSVLIGREKLIDYHRCISELKGLVCEECLDDDSCGSITDEEGLMYQDMTPNGKPLPYLDGLSLDVKVPSTKKKRRNKKKQSQMMCQPCGLMECEAMGLASCGPLTKDHFRTHMPKHPGCEICRFTKPQASPHLRISDKRKKAFGKIDDEGNLIEIRRPADAHKLPEHFGDLITADHMTSVADDEQSWLKDSVALTIQDKATYMIWGHPAKHKDAV